MANMSINIYSMSMASNVWHVALLINMSNTDSDKTYVTKITSVILTNSDIILIYWSLCDWKWRIPFSVMIFISFGSIRDDEVMKPGDLFVAIHSSMSFYGAGILFCLLIKYNKWKIQSWLYAILLHYVKLDIHLIWSRTFWKGYSCVCLWQKLTNVYYIETDVRWRVNLSLCDKLLFYSFEAEYYSNSVDITVRCLPSILLLF